MQRASIAALAGIAVHYAGHHLLGTPLLTESIAEWIMARTPSRYALLLLDGLGAWAKPFAATGGLAALGAVLWLAEWRWWVGLAGALGISIAIDYENIFGATLFWLPAAAVLFARGTEQYSGSRRRYIQSAVMMLGTSAVALESYLRNESLARQAVTPVPLAPFRPPEESERFAPPLVRRAVTSVEQFYGMSKNTVDPAIDPQTWRLRITVDGAALREFRYADLFSLPRIDRYVTLRCVSNTLQSDLMGTALWSGIRLSQLVDRTALPQGILEAAVIGVDGHGDSLPLDYAFHDETLFALGMNGQTLNRTHGFPIRLLAPKYYGFKNVKWIGEIRFTAKPYYGTWPKMGYTKEPVIHTCSHIDRVIRGDDGLLVGGVSFAGSRGIRNVQVRADDGAWTSADLEQPLSPFTWTRWRVLIPVRTATVVEAQAQDGLGNWQAGQETPLFPNGVAGPTVRRVSL
ncbi:MAG: molybdopterin-dependent oxidoreductase [Bryobacterales bacterium]|nr:molybdopterin-dependent oxidoreductase [Bryobacterales bacterium]